ncbi:MAG: ArnT family glycosyltransferase [Gemmataceae bacterium]
MFRSLNHRPAHHLVILTAAAVLTLPGLGRASLWDMDEGLNAEAAREMLESGNWVVPKFSFQLRDAKPALLYWLQAGTYRLFGVNEFAARLPSALAAALAALLSYELARRMFSPAAGLLGGLILISTLTVSQSGRFANPDALLLGCTALTFSCFWAGYAPGRAGEPPRRGWFVPLGATCGLGMLAKGPVGLVLPGATILLFLAWQRQLWTLLDRRLFLGAAAFLLVALPWYAAVSIETRGDFATGFFLKNNFGRYLRPMEDHRGPVYYHAGVLLMGFAPWSALLPVALWYAMRRPAAANTPFSPVRATDPARRLLLCWFAVYLAFFSLSATKLPNYTLPLYPAVALLTGQFLDCWRRGETRPPVWLVTVGLASLPAIGIGTVAALQVLGGGWSIPSLHVTTMENLQRTWWIGLIPILGGLLGLLGLIAGRRRLVIGSFCVTSVLFLSALGLFLADRVDALKATRGLVAEAHTFDRGRDIRLASFQYTQPSLVFYNQREVRPLLNDEQVVEFLNSPLPAYLFVPEPVWNAVAAKHPGLARPTLARKWDLYKQCEIIVVSNQAD